MRAEDRELHALQIEPRPTEEHGGDRQPVQGPHVPDFHEFSMRLQQSATDGPPTGSSSSKVELQMAKIVRMVKKQLPSYTEAEIQRHVDEVRRSQGGFSRMTLNAIVATVLSHMKNTTMHGDE